METILLGKLRQIQTQGLVKKSKIVYFKLKAYKLDGPELI